MSDLAGYTDLTNEPLQRSLVKIETNSKGMAQVKVTVCEGTTEDEMQRIKDIAVRVYERTISELGTRANF